MTNLYYIILYCLNDSIYLLLLLFLSVVRNIRRCSSAIHRSRAVAVKSFRNTRTLLRAYVLYNKCYNLKRTRHNNNYCFFQLKT